MTTVAKVIFALLLSTLLNSADSEIFTLLKSKEWVSDKKRTIEWVKEFRPGLLNSPSIYAVGLWKFKVTDSKWLIYSEGLEEPGEQELEYVADNDDDLVVMRWGKGKTASFLIFEIDRNKRGLSIFRRSFGGPDVEFREFFEAK